MSQILETDSLSQAKPQARDMFNTLGDLRREDIDDSESFLQSNTLIPSCLQSGKCGSTDKIGIDSVKYSEAVYTVLAPVTE